MRKRALRGRRLVLVDIENVVGGAVLAVEQASQARHVVDAAARLKDGDHVVIATSHIGLLPTGLGWAGARLLVRSGPDGADLALLDVLTEEQVEARFDEVVVASGDGIFTDAVAALGAAGVAVTVVARPDGCSRRLRMAASRTISLDCAAVDFGDAA
jgi:hypothetical protein